MIPRIAIALFAVAVLVTPARALITGEDVVSVPTRDGVTNSFIFLGPRTGNPPAIILFAGGGGVIFLDEWNEKGAKGDPSTNFLVRTRKLFADNGLLVAVPDAPSDLVYSYGLDHHRMEQGHVQDIREIIRYLRRFTQGPVYLVGTSRGTESATSLASRMRPDELGGIVLTSTVTRPTRSLRGDVFDAKLENIRVPVLISSHMDDACYVTPSEDSPRIKSKLTAAPSVEIKIYRGGGSYRGSVCGPLAAHGFRGIESRVVADIAAWIKRQGGAASPR